MKCPKCNGSGIDYDNEFIEVCENCDGIGIVNPLTNEEWFCSLSTEKKAEFLIESIKKCKHCVSGIGDDEVPECPFGECGCHFKDEVVKWLKEKHNG